MKPSQEQILSWLLQQPTMLIDPKQTFTLPLPAQLCTDSRSIEKHHSWFVPLKGEFHDAHKFIDAVVKAQAAGVFYDPNEYTPDEYALKSSTVFIAVHDTYQTWIRYARGLRRLHKDIKITAITGSTGKTTVRNMVECIFREFSPTLSTTKNLNNEFGVPQTLFQIAEDQRLGVIEMGARKPGDIKLLTEIIEPDVVCTLNFGNSHFGIFGSTENLIKTKTESFFCCPDHAKIVFFHDQKPLLDTALTSGRETFSFGFHPSSTLQIIESKLDSAGLGTNVSLLYKNEVFEVHVPSLHDSTAINASAAAAIALASDLSIEHIQSGLTKYTSPRGRFRVFKKRAATIIDDAYNANPASIRAGIQSLMKNFGSNKKIIILGDMLELGQIETGEHKKVGALLSSLNQAVKVFLVGPRSRHTLETAVEQGFDSDHLLYFEDIDLLLDGFDFSVLDQNTTLYIKASNGIGLHKLVNLIENQ